MTNFRKTKLALAIMGTLSLVACGGGSSGSSGSSSSSGGSGGTDNPPVVNETKEVELQVIDGYLVETFVFADLNKNYKYDEGEPSGRTDSKGKVKLNVPKDSQGNIKVFAQAKKGDKNVILGKESNLSKDIVLSTSIFFENGDVAASPIISPYTTLLNNKVNNAQQLTKQVFDNLLDKIAVSLGLTKDIITSDYNDEEEVKNDPNKVKALVTGEILVRNDVIPTDLDKTKDVSEQSASDSSGSSDSTSTEVKEDEVIGQVETVVSDFKEIIEEVVQDPEITGNLENIESIGEKIDEKIEKAVAKLGNSFKSLSGEEADEYRCGVSNSNNVFCWGHNSAGALGNPNAYKDADGNYITDGYDQVDLYSSKPLAVMLEDGETPLANVKRVATGNGHACAVTYDGDVYCWGQNYRGQVGYGKISEELPIIPYANRVVKGHQNKDKEGVEYLSNIKDIALAHNTSCALTNDGEVYCWGENSSMQMGGEFPGEDNIEVWKDTKSIEGIPLYGIIKGVAYPVQVKFPETVAKVNYITGGIFAYCALADNKDVTDKHNMYCWGSDIRGTVTHNWSQYLDDFNEKYNGILKVQDQSRYVSNKSNWEWTIHEDGGDYFPIYGAPVHQIRDATYVYGGFEIGYSKDLEGLPGLDSTVDDWLNYDKFFREKYNNLCSYISKNGDERCVIEVTDPEDSSCRKVKVSDVNYFDISNVTMLKLREFDAIPTFIMNDDSMLWGIYNNGKDATSHWSDINPYATNGEKIVNIYGNVEEKTSFVLTNAGKLYPITNKNKYGLLGLGHQDAYNFEYDSVRLEDGSYLSYINNLPAVKDSSGYAITNIVDVSLNKRSICAAQKTISEDNKVDYKLYCWGSSTFGQLGFDNGDGGFSYNDTAKLWTGYTDDNAEFDKPNRIETTPKVINIFDVADEE